MRFPGASIWGRIHLGAQGVRWLQISAGAAGHQVAEQDQEGEWKPE